MTEQQTYVPRVGPNVDMLARPEGMSRQVHRRLYRFACRYHKVEPQFLRPTDKKQVRKTRKQIARMLNDRPSRHQLNLERKAQNKLRATLLAALY